MWILLRNYVLNRSRNIRKKENFLETFSSPKISSPKCALSGNFSLLRSKLKTAAFVNLKDILRTIFKLNVCIKLNVCMSKIYKLIGAFVDP